MNPTPTPLYPPSIDIPGNPLPLIWGALALVLIVLIAVILANRQKQD